MVSSSLELRGVSQRYGSSQILWDIDMHIPQGSRVCVMGRNGVGKTTLIKCIMGLQPLLSGQVLINGQEMTQAAAERRAAVGVGYVPQGRDIFPQLSVEENLRIGLAHGRRRKTQIPAKIYQLFPVLAEMRQRRGGDLSGGQQQQLAIARALVLEPDILILDEPNEGIQPSIVSHIREVMIQLNQQEGMTILLVEQKLNFARAVGEAFFLLEKGQVVASGVMSALTDQLVSQHLAV